MPSLKVFFLRLKAYKARAVYIALIIILFALFAAILWTKFSHRERNILAAEQNKQLVVFDMETKKQIPASTIFKSQPKDLRSVQKTSATPNKPAEIGFIISLPNSERGIVEKAISLPPQFIISFSPSSDQSLELSKSAKDAGHDTVMELPVAGGKDSWGNLNLSIENTDFKNQKNFEAALSKIFNPSAVLLPAGEVFSESNNFTPILRMLAKNKLYLISENDDNSIDAKTKDNDVNLVKIDAVLDKPEDLPNQFVTLEDLARKYDFILVIFESPSLENIDALNKWQATLKDKNIKLTSSH